MTEPEDTNEAKRVGIAKKTSGEFLRYGFKKTSMDDLARAAGMSRQGLYLHFPTKEALFRQTVLQMVSSIRTSAREALEREDLDVESRVLGAYAALHGYAIGQGGAEHMSELLETAERLLGPVVSDLEQGLINDVSRLLRNNGVAAAWTDAGVSPKDLAENLFAVSYGCTRRVTTDEEYREKMRVAVKLVCGGQAR